MLESGEKGLCCIHPTYHQKVHGWSDDHYSWQSKEFFQKGVLLKYDNGILVADFEHNVLDKVVER